MQVTWIVQISPKILSTVQQEEFTSFALFFASEF